MPDGAAVSAAAPFLEGSVLHAGCGTESLPVWLTGPETRLDIDPACGPHIVASMTDLGDIGPFDYVLSQHALEHLYPHEVPVALSEFYRVLRTGGTVLIWVPDLEGVTASDDVLFVSPAGPITGMDLIYGHRPQLKDRPAMAHHCGFMAGSLAAALKAAGFRDVRTKRMSSFNLLGVGVK